MALRAALSTRYPQLAKIHLTDYKVRILDGATATGAVTRVLIDATNGDRSWTTIGVSSNIIEASWRALEESLVFGLLHSAGVELEVMAAPQVRSCPSRGRRSYVWVARFGAGQLVARSSR